MMTVVTGDCGGDGGSSGGGSGSFFWRIRVWLRKQAGMPWLDHRYNNM